MLLVAGEALFDMMGHRTEAGEAFLPVVGGSPLNVAMGLARLGRRTAFLTKLSTDFFGDRLDAFMAAEGIDRRLVVRAPGLQTTLAFVALGADGQPVYSFYGTGAADRSMTEADLPSRLDPDITTIHFGSIALAQEPTAGTLDRFMARMADDKVISLDPNIRPSIIPDRRVWLDRFACQLARVDIVKASAEDVAWIEGEGADLETVARRWSRAGPAFALITDGGRGVHVARGGQHVFMSALPVAVADTIGAGDTFQAALLARLDEQGLLAKSALRMLSDDRLADAIGFAIAAAAITCTRRGADLPRRSEVAAMLLAA